MPVIMMRIVAVAASVSNGLGNLRAERRIYEHAAAAEKKVSETCSRKLAINYSKASLFYDPRN